MKQMMPAPNETHVDACFSDLGCRLECMWLCKQVTPGAQQSVLLVFPLTCSCDDIILSCKHFYIMACTASHFLACLEWIKQDPTCCPSSVLILPCICTLVLLHRQIACLQSGDIRSVLVFCVIHHRVCSSMCFLVLPGAGWHSFRSLAHAQLTVSSHIMLIEFPCCSLGASPERAAAHWVSLVSLRSSAMYLSHFLCCRPARLSR